MLCPADNFAESFEFGQDGVGGSGPHKGPRVLIVVLDELIDLAFEVRHGVKGAASDGALCDQSEPALDLVEPGGVGRSVVDMEARTLGEPDFDTGVPVGAVVIDDQMNIQMLRDIGLDMTQKAQELLMAVPRFALREDLSVGDIERREQGRGAMSDVVVGDAFHVAQTHWQHRLRALQGLHLALLVDTQNQRFVWWIQVQPNHVAKLLDEERVGRELEGLGSMGLYAEQRQIALHGALGDPSLIGQLAHTPVRGPLGSARQRGVEQHRDVLFAVGARPPGFKLIVQTGQTLLSKALAPIGNRRRCYLHTPRRLAYRHSAFRQQNHIRAPYQPVRQAA